MIPLEHCRDDFPVLVPQDGKSAVYLDSAATTLKPRAVVDAVRWFLEQGTAAVHRAVHSHALDATDRFEATREKVARWFGADTDEIVFTHGATEGINLVRQGWQPLRRVATTVMEHHSNFVPWLDCEKCHVIAVDPAGQIDLAALETALTEGVDLLAVTHVSNMLGTLVDLSPVITVAHRHGAKVLVDAAQSASHHPIDVHDLGIDFLVCSSHKMLGPSGVGALFVDRDRQEELRPTMLGGHMVDQVTACDWSPQPAPQCYEAGTPAIESVIGWGAAIDYLRGLGTDAIRQRLDRLTSELLNRLNAIEGVRVHGPNTPGHGPLVSFSVEGLEAPAVAKILSQRDKILVRSGFHCAQPLHQHLGLKPTLRASLQVYNNDEDLDRFAKTLTSIVRLGALG